METGNWRLQDLSIRTSNESRGGVVEAQPYYATQDSIHMSVAQSIVYITLMRTYNIITCIETTRMVPPEA